MTLRWTRRALLDLQRLADRIAADGKPMAATTFVKQLRESIDLLAEQPLMGRAGRRSDTREWVVHRHYLVTYRLHGDEVQVLQLWHSARLRQP